MYARVCDWSSGELGHGMWLITVTFDSMCVKRLISSLLLRML